MASLSKSGSYLKLTLRPATRDGDKKAGKEPAVQLSMPDLQLLLKFR